jgi:S-adenosylmethionine:tRNA ribosyltransferase-isomerase
MLVFVRTSDFDFALPAELIAQRPAEPRDASRLMVLQPAAGTVAHHRFSDLPVLLEPGAMLVVNDTRVMAARLFGTRPDTGGAVEALLVRPLTDTRWEALFRPARQAVAGRRFVFRVGGEELSAVVMERAEGVVVFEFERAFDPATAGDLPLPPYIKGFDGDPERYQTVYSREARSAAAPTAGLHFTPALLEALSARGIERAAVTLEVGPGTFKPVTADDPREHHLHAEHYTIPAATVAAICTAKQEGRRVVAIGTTVVRTLEQAARDGRFAPDAPANEVSGWTSLRILPGDPFLAVDVLVTNFHLPRSTLLMLVCALAGQEFVLDAYGTAVREGYRFYSFGDAMLVLP